MLTSGRGSNFVIDAKSSTTRVRAHLPVVNKERIDAHIQETQDTETKRAYARPRATGCARARPPLWEDSLPLRAGIAILKTPSFGRGLGSSRADGQQCDGLVDGACRFL